MMAQNEVEETFVEEIKMDEGVDDVRLEAAISIQRLYRSRLARKQLRDLLQSIMERYYDEDSGLYYYYNKRTGQSTWTKPKVLGEIEVPLSTMYDSKSIVQEPKESTLELKDVEEEEEEEENDDEKKQDEPEEVENEKEEEDKDHKVISDFSPQEIELIRKQFDQYDIDHSGTISPEELLKILQSLGENLTLKSVKEMIDAVDVNKNGEVEFDEFCEILKKQRNKNVYAAPLDLAMVFGPKEIENLRRQFIKLDTDGSGFIEEKEIQTLIQMVGQKVEDYDLKALIQEVDLDQNGTISFNEFLRLVYTMVHPKEHSQNQKGLAKLLSMGIAQGVLNELEDAIAKSKVIFHEWWNADLIAEEKRLEAKREKRRKQLEAKRIKQEKDRQVYNQHQQILQEREKKRWQPIDGLVHEIEFKGDQNNYPNIGQYARIHYVGMLQNGTVVESTRKRGGALEIRVGAGHVIQGFDLALQRMSVGETAKITLAPILAYGAKGRPPKIPPNAILIFRIELISIKEKVLPLDIMLDG